MDFKCEGNTRATSASPPLLEKPSTSDAAKIILSRSGNFGSFWNNDNSVFGYLKFFSVFIKIIPTFAPGAMRTCLSMMAFLIFATRPISTLFMITECST